MLSQIGKAFKSLVVGDNDSSRNVNRKRQRDDSDDDDDVTITYAKRSKHSEHDKGAQRPWSFGQAAEYLVRSGKSFSQSFYIKPFSPRRIVERVFRRKVHNNHSVQSSTGPQFVSPQVMESSRAWGPPNAMHPSACPAPPPPGALPPPSAPTRGGPGQKSPTTPKTGYVDLPYPFMFAPDGIWTQDMQFKVPTGKPPPTAPPGMDHRIQRPPLGRTPSMNNSMGGMSYNGQPQRHPLPINRLATYTPTYDRLYSQHSQQSGRSSRSNSIRKYTHLTARSSVRMEEKTRYAQLLQMNTSVLLHSTTNGTSFHHHSKKSATPARDKTLIGTSIPHVKQRDHMPITIPEPAVQEVTPHPLPSASTPHPVIDLTERSYRSMQHRRSQEQLSRSRQSQERAAHLPVTGRLSAQSDMVTPATSKTSVTEKRQSPTKLSFDEVVILDSPSSSPTPMSPTLRSPLLENFEKGLRGCKRTEEWLKQTQEDYRESKNRRELEIRKEQEELKYFEEKRELHNEQLEQRLRRQLKLSEREPVAEKYDYIESSESEEEVEEEEDDEFIELTDEQEQMVNNSLRPQPAGELLSEGFRLQIRRSDMDTLRGLNWLNDEIVNFYFELIRERGKLDNFPSVHVFNTFFYPKVKSQGHQGVRRWTKSVDIFSFDYIAIPIHLGMHWCLAVIDMCNQAIRYFDSMGGKNMECLNVLKKYLNDEHQQKKGSPYDLSAWTLENVTGIPQQMNGSDCGVFTCKYADYVTRSREITFTQAQMPYFRRRMVFEIVTKQLLP